MAKLSELVKNQIPEEITENKDSGIKEVQRPLILRFEGKISLFGDGSNNRGIAYLEVVHPEDMASYEVLDKDGNIDYISTPWRKRINFDLNRKEHKALWWGVEAQHKKNPENKYTFYVTLNPFRGSNGGTYISLWINEIEIY